MKKYLKQLEIKQELDNMAKMQEIKNKLLAEIKTIVDSTVGSNMQIADAMKKELDLKLLAVSCADSLKN